MKHTQGEWKIWENNIQTTIHGRSFQICEMNKHASKEDNEANAKLIAAAPDLLNALIYLEDYVRRELTVVHALKQAEIDFILNQPRSAIKKATT